MLLSSTYEVFKRVVDHTARILAHCCTYDLKRHYISLKYILCLESYKICEIYEIYEIYQSNT